MVECPRCGSEMREGEAFVRITTSADQVSSGYGMLGMPGMRMPSGETSEEKVQWREKTGQRKGWLIKRDETKTLKISGLRCVGCGYLEFYARG